MLAHRPLRSFLFRGEADVWDKWEGYIALAIVLGLPLCFFVAWLLRSIGGDGQNDD